MIKPVIKLIQALQSNTSPQEIGAGMALSLYFGFTPLASTHTVFLVLLFFVFKINRASTVVLLPLVKLLDVLLIRGLADRMGYALLTEVAFLEGLWSWITQAPVLTYLNLNHTLVLGGMVIAGVLTPLVYWAGIRGVLAYREKYREQMQEWRVLKWIKGWTITQWILKWWP